MLFKWNKLGRVFDPTAVKDRYFINEFAQAPHVVVFDDFIRVYFSCRPPADEHGQYVSYSSWLDLDRKDLFKVLRIAEHPILPLGELGTFDEFGTYPVSVVRHGDEMRAYYAGWTRCESVPFNVAIGMAVSHDEGQTFERIGPGPILSYSHDEPFILSGPKIRRFNDKWYLFYIAGKKCPSIELSGSSMPVATALQARPGGAPDASVAASRSAASGSCRAIAIRRSRLARDSRRPSR